MRLLPLLVIAVLAVPSCVGPDENSARVVLTPMPSAPIDPPDAVLEASLEHFLSETGAPAASVYTFTRHDLNNDGRRDALVMLEKPYGYWCGLHGCTLLVMQAQDSGFSLVNAVQPVRAPLHISNLESNGWKNIIIHVSGRREETKDVALQFDGKAYPAHPSELPPYLRLASKNDTRVLNNP